MSNDDKDAVVVMYYDPEKKVLICPEHAKQKEKLIQLAARKNSVCYYCYNEKKSGSLRIV